MSARLNNIIYYSTLPGIFLHELAHAFVIWVLPNTNITKLNLKSHVEYKSYNMTATRTFFIGYAPLFFNTIISLISIYVLTQINLFENITSVLLSVGLIYLSLVTAFTALPSVSDALAPLKSLYTQLFTLRFPIVILIGPLFITLSIPGLIISYISQKSVFMQFILCFIYTLFVFVIGFDVIGMNELEFLISYVKNI